MEMTADGDKTGEELVQTIKNLNRVTLTSMGAVAKLQGMVARGLDPTHQDCLVVYDTEPHRVLTGARCAARHIGLWMAEPVWLGAMIQAYRNGELTMAGHESAEPFSESFDVLYTLDSDGIATIPMFGGMIKGDSKFGDGVNTLRSRRALAVAANDPEAKAIMLHIDSPGGTLAGTMELADAVQETRKAKTVFAHSDDSVASAALWVAVQAETLTANATGEVGSIGTVAVVQDSSAAAEAEGIKVHVVSTGEFKGMGAPGTEVTENHLAEIQKRVDAGNEFFLKGVVKGRGMSPSAVRELADGRMFSAAEAKQNGLIDGVMSFEGARTALVKRVRAAERERKSKSAGSLRTADMGLRLRECE